MATYAIGDVHGHFATLRRLLRRIAFTPGRDRLWLVGDLVNRGPRSLDVLRWAAGQGDRLVAVLGNHDLHLLARAAGVARRKKRDTLEEVLAAPDAADLLAWLRSRPFLHREGDRALLHAGLLPGWSLDCAQALAGEAQAAIRGEDGQRLLAAYAGGGGQFWREDLSPFERALAAGVVFTTLRTLNPADQPCPGFSGPPAEAPPGCRPWFDVPDRASRGTELVFGHWAALGLYLAGGLVALDTGCAWGGPLTALRLDDRRVFQEPAGG